MSRACLRSSGQMRTALVATRLALPSMHAGCWILGASALRSILVYTAMIMGVTADLLPA